MLVAQLLSSKVSLKCFVGMRAGYNADRFQNVFTFLIIGRFEILFLIDLKPLALDDKRKVPDMVRVADLD